MPEILAPAGNMEMLKAAVINGADAVYLGLNRFSARAKAENFGGDRLKDAIDYAHLFGVKVYVAINTLIKNDEMPDALNAAAEALGFKADALILQDLGLATLIREKFPNAVLHASTQMGIHNAYGAAIAKKLGFSRVILSRETLLEDIIKIKQSVDIELECFVQGALCIAFSGNCYFSSFASGYSGNRGKCMQLCRKQYSVKSDGKNVEGYLLSAKDLMLAGKIGELIKAGIDCFKIEGRLRRAEYVAESVRVYKRAIGGSFDKNDLIALKKVFNRGDYTEGHLFTPTNKVIDYKICGHKGLLVGKVLNVSGKVAKLDVKLNKGDGVKFLRAGKEVGSASIAKSGFETGFDGNIKPSDEVYITTDSEFNSSVLLRERKLPINVCLDFNSETLTVQYNDIVADCKIEGAMPAINQPITKDDLISSFNKSEYFTAVNAEVKGEYFLTKAVLNGLRRSAYDILKTKILDNYHNNMPIYDGNCLSMTDIVSKNINSFLQNKTIYQVESANQITDEMEIIAINPREYSVKNLEQFKPFTDRALLNLPCIARGKDIDVLKELIGHFNFKGYIVNNLYGLELVKDNVILGYGLNIINDTLHVPKIYSFESDSVLNNGYIYAEGNIPLMNFCHCVKKELINNCENCRGYDITMTYENRNFYLRRYKVYYCYGQLLNCANLAVAVKGANNNKFIDYSFKRADTFTKGNYNRGLK